MKHILVTNKSYEIASMYAKEAKLSIREIFIKGAICYVLLHKLFGSRVDKVIKIAEIDLETGLEKFKELISRKEIYETPTIHATTQRVIETSKYITSIVQTITTSQKISEIPKQIEKQKISRKEELEKELTELPEFLKDNPWVEIISRRLSTS